MSKNPGILFVITAPSGAGKTTLVQAVLKYFGNSELLDRVITYTTRDARTHERSGIDYHFVSPEQFQKLQDTGFFLESSQAYGNWYGSPRSILGDLQVGKSYIMILDAQGVATLQAQQIPACYIALCPSSRDLIIQRLEHRGSEDLQSLEFRKNLIEHELNTLQNLVVDYFITNDHIDIAIDRLVAIIKDNISPEEGPNFNAKNYQKQDF